MSEKEYTEKDITLSVLVVLVCAVVTLVAVVFAFKYSDMRDQRNALIQREEMRRHDEALMKGQRDYTVHEMTERMATQTHELYPGASQDGDVKLVEPPPTIVEEDDTPDAIKEVGERHAREDAAGQQRSYAPGLPE